VLGQEAVVADIHRAVITAEEVLAEIILRGVMRAQGIQKAMGVILAATNLAVETAQAARILISTFVATQGKTERM
jgi:hypothetical protein